MNNLDPQTLTKTYYFLFPEFFELLWFVLLVKLLRHTWKMFAMVSAFLVYSYECWNIRLVTRVGEDKDVISLQQLQV